MTVFFQFLGFIHVCLGIWCFTNFLELDKTTEQKKTSLWVGSLSILMGLFLIFKFEIILKWLSL